jgi:hypothetical protein
MFKVFLVVGLLVVLNGCSRTYLPSSFATMGNTPVLLQKAPKDSVYVNGAGSFYYGAGDGWNREERKSRRLESGSVVIDTFKLEQQNHWG